MIHRLVLSLLALPIFSLALADTLIGKPAPNFKATAYLPSGDYKDIELTDYRGKYVVLYWYPGDWTFVCASELLAFSERKEEFSKRGVEILGISVDSHLCWNEVKCLSG